MTAVFRPEKEKSYSLSCTVAAVKGNASFRPAEASLSIIKPPG